MGLTFMEPRVAPVMEILDAALSGIPRRGAIKGTTLIMLQGLVCLLQNPTALLEHGQGIIDGRRNAQGVLEALLASPDAWAASSTHPVSSAAEKDASEDEPSFAVEQTPPVIDSHGL